MTEKLILVLASVENSMGKGEDAGFQHFFLFLQCFQKASYTVLFKVEIVWLQRVNNPNLKHFETKN